MSPSPGPVSRPQPPKQFQKVLDEVAVVKDVIGCCIVGHDGAMLAEHLPENLDGEFLGLSALALYNASASSIKQIKHDKLHQMVLRTGQGYTAIADFEGGLLVTLTKDLETGPPTKVLQKISQQLNELKQI